MSSKRKQYFDSILVIVFHESDTHFETPFLFPFALSQRTVRQICEALPLNNCNVVCVDWHWNLSLRSDITSHRSDQRSDAMIYDLCQSWNAFAVNTDGRGVRGVRGAEHCSALDQKWSFAETETIQPIKQLNTYSKVFGDKNITFSNFLRIKWKFLDILII